MITRGELHFNNFFPVLYKKSMGTRLENLFFEIRGQRVKCSINVVAQKQKSVILVFFFFIASDALVRPNKNSSVLRLKAEL